VQCVANRYWLPKCLLSKETCRPADAPLGQMQQQEEGEGRMDLPQTSFGHSTHFGPVTVLPEPVGGPTSADDDDDDDDDDADDDADVDEDDDSQSHDAGKVALNGKGQGARAEAEAAARIVEPFGPGAADNAPAAAAAVAPSPTARSRGDSLWSAPAATNQWASSAGIHNRLPATAESPQQMDHRGDGAGVAGVESGAVAGHSDVTVTFEGPKLGLILTARHLDGSEPASNETCAYLEITAVSPAFPSWKRSILTEIYPCHACSYHEVEDMETPGQVRELSAAHGIFAPGAAIKSVQVRAKRSHSSTDNSAPRN
jgi:hypothetical protein